MAHLHDIILVRYWTYDHVFDLTEIEAALIDFNKSQQSYWKRFAQDVHFPVRKDASSALFQLGDNWISRQSRQKTPTQEKHLVVCHSSERSRKCGASHLFRRVLSEFDASSVENDLLNSEYLLSITIPRRSKQTNEGGFADFPYWIPRDENQTFRDNIDMATE